MLRGSLVDIEKILEQIPDQIDHDIVQRACDLNLADHLRCLLNHNMNRCKVVELQENLSVKSEEVYDVLTSFKIPDNQIDIQWDALLLTFSSEEKRRWGSQALHSKADFKEGKRRKPCLLIIP